MTYAETITGPHPYEERETEYTFIGCITHKGIEAAALYNSDDGQTVSLDRIVRRCEEQLDNIGPGIELLEKEDIDTLINNNHP